MPYSRLSALRILLVSENERRDSLYESGGTVIVKEVEVL